MRRLYALCASTLLVAAGSLLVAPLRLRAIVFGFVDTHNSFSNAGAFIVKAPGGGIFPECSGTLIAPTVFLTASHCTAPFEASLAPFGYTAFISFDNPIPFGDLTSAATHLLPVTQVITNPLFKTVGQREEDPNDIALLLLRAGDTLGITPATLPPAGLLDTLGAKNGLKDAVFTAVGYGLQNRVNGGGQPFFQDLNPAPRMYAFSNFNALTQAYLHLSENPVLGNGGTCFGDSGGPNFFNYNGTRLLAAITITGDAVCRSANVVLRLDTDSARQFLASYMALP
jgi:hypothetical protein